MNNAQSEMDVKLLCGCLIGIIGYKLNRVLPERCVEVLTPLSVITTLLGNNRVFADVIKIRLYGVSMGPKPSD